MKASEMTEECKIEAFRQSIENLCDERSNITRELTESSQFKKCVLEDKKNETREGRTESFKLDLVEDVEQFTVTTGIKLTSDLDKTGLTFIDEVCPDGTKLSGSFLSGKPHGFFRIMNKYGDLVFFGSFIHGRIHGQSWKSFVGGGFLLNPESKNIEFSGQNLVYFYPDCQTALVGTFEHSSMLSAQTTEIISTKDNCCGLQVPIFGAFEDPTYTLDISTDKVISKNPLIPDPYEAFFVYVSDSQIPGAGEGLFAKLNVEQGTVLAFYNGVRKPSVPPSEESFEDTPYKISLSKRTDMDIPPEFTSLKTYSSSLAHKVCHSFTPNCDFDKYDHPRFGVVLCIVALRYISAGEELTVDYKYDLNVAPAWYKKSWARHQKKVRGIPNWQTALSQSRTYRRTYSSQHLNNLPL